MIVDRGGEVAANSSQVQIQSADFIGTKKLVIEK
jgi:hypothetical protein